MRLLVTRPEPDAARTAQALAACGHEAVVAPLMRVEPVAAEFGGPFAAVLITSANAARAVTAHPRAGELTALPAYTVGARTAEAARDAGFANVTSADAALGALVHLVVAHGPSGALLYLAGEDRAGDLVGALGAHGFTVETAVVYRAVAADLLPPEILFARLDGVLHYSRRSAETLLRLAGAAGVHSAVLGLAHYCLSDEVAQPLRQAGAMRIFTAASPTESALLVLVQ